jgi:hypothetical protein
MNANATIMLRAERVLLKSFQTASLSPHPLDACFVHLEIVFILEIWGLAVAVSLGPGAIEKMIEFGHYWMESDAVGPSDFP